MSNNLFLDFKFWVILRRTKERLRRTCDFHCSGDKVRSVWLQKMWQGAWNPFHVQNLVWYSIVCSYFLVLLDNYFCSGWCLQQQHIKISILIWFFSDIWKMIGRRISRSIQCKIWSRKFAHSSHDAPPATGFEGIVRKYLPGNHHVRFHIFFVEEVHSFHYISFVRWYLEF